MTLIRNEPAVIVALVEALLVAVANAVMAFGLVLTGDQVAAVNGVVIALLVLLLSIYTRQRVTPTAKL